MNSDQLDAEQPPLFPVCVLPGCGLPAGQVGEACPDCRAAFGDRLQRRPSGTPMTTAQIEERDTEVKQAYAAMRRKVNGPAEGERVRNQICWLCEERRTCTRRDGAWECDSCQAHDAGEAS